MSKKVSIRPDKQTFYDRSVRLAILRYRINMWGKDEEIEDVGKFPITAKKGYDLEA